MTHLPLQAGEPLQLSSGKYPSGTAPLAPCAATAPFQLAHLSGQG